MIGTIAYPASERIARPTASPWSFGVWFGFTYLLPASLVGREAAMR